MIKYKYRTLEDDFGLCYNQRKIPFLPIWEDYGNRDYKFFSQREAEEYLYYVGLLKESDNKRSKSTCKVYYYRSE